MRLLVTGGAGFIGSTFVRRRLAATADDIVVLDVLTYAGNRANLADIEGDPAAAARLRFVEGDIADPSVAGELVRDVDAVVNFAAESHVDRSILDAAAFLRTGVIGVHVLLEAARSAAAHRTPDGRGGPRFVQVSTDEVYGSVAEGHSAEDDAVEPRSPYAAAKAAGDLLVRAYHATHGLDTVVSRGANTYGPFQHPEKLVPLFITNALQDQPLPLYGDGLQARDWLFVDDHADAISTVLDRGKSGGVYNIAAGGERTNREVTEAILRHTGRPWTLVRQVEDRPAHDRRYAMDGARLRSLGWQPQVPFDEGIARTVEWYRSHEDWWRSLRGDDWAAYYEDQYGRRLAHSVEA
ncbi:MAG: dTDP-glucose 4,6-dehydratase [Chloroflexota bacterium]